MSEVVHSIIDSDAHFILDPITKRLSTSSKKRTLIQGDHNSERYTFELPLLLDGHDMSLCTSAEVHYINIENRTKATSEDIYEASDLAIVGDKVTFSWLIRNTATRYTGSLNFLLKLKCVDQGDVLLYEYNTEVYSKISVSAGMNNTEAVIAASTDILASWKTQVLADVRSEVGTAQTEIDALVEGAENTIAAAVTAAKEDVDEYIETAETDFASVVSEAQTEIDTTIETAKTAAETAKTAAQSSASQAAVSATNAASSASSASSSATAANTAADKAESKADDAEASAEAAAADAEKALNKANDANQSATAAAGSATSAASSATSASGSASVAVGARTAAETAADQALTNAQNAAASASAASSSEYYAGEHAGAASGYAASASESAAEAAASAAEGANLYANALKGKAEGSMIVVDDVSPVTHSPLTFVRSINMFNADILVNDVFVKNADSTFTITKNGTNRFSAEKLFDKPIPAGNQVTVSLGSYTGNLPMLTIQLLSEDRQTTKNITLSPSTLSKTVELTFDACKYRVFAAYYETDESYATLGDIQVRIGTSAEGYLPYVAPSSVTVTRCGQNLMEQNSITVSGTGSYTFAWTEEKPVPSGDYILTCDFKQTGTDTCKITASVRDVDNATSQLGGMYSTEASGSLTVSFTVPDGMRGFRLCFYSNNDAAAYNSECLFSNIQVVRGNTAKEYQAYTGSTFTPAADGTVEGIESVSPTMTIYTDTAGTVIECEYNRDTTAVMEGMNESINTLDNSLATVIEDVGEAASGIEALEAKPNGVMPYQSYAYHSAVLITPNKLMHFAPLAGAIDIVLGEGVEGWDNEWAFIITQGDTAQTVSLPEIEWVLGMAPSFGANTTTEIRLHYKGDVLEGVWL